VGRPSVLRPPVSTVLEANTWAINEPNRGEVVPEGDLIPALPTQWKRYSPASEDKPRPGSPFVGPGD
jgi:hypothetical protein